MQIGYEPFLVNMGVTPQIQRKLVRITSQNYKLRPQGKTLTEERERKNKNDERRKGEEMGGKEEMMREEDLLQEGRSHEHGNLGHSLGNIFYID